MSQGNRPDSSSGQQSPFYHMYNNFNHPQEQDKKRNPISGDMYPPQQQAPPPPPPYSVSDTASQPSAPPLMEQHPYTTYNPNSYPKDNNNNVYPPRGYLYGSVPQQHHHQESQPPLPTNPAVSNWSWFSPQTPMIPANTQPPAKNPKRLCQFFTYSFLCFFFGILMFDFFRMIFEGIGNRSCSHNGVVWTRLPNEILFEGNLRVSTTGDGYFSSGNIKLVETDDEYPQGTILPIVRVSPKSILDDLDFTLTTDKDNETHLEFRLPTQHNWRHCIHLEMTIYVPRHMNALSLNVQNTAIKTENERLLIDSLDMATSNAMIGIGSEWQGESLALTTSNGRILLDGPALGETSVTLKSSNGRLDTKKVAAKETIQLTTSNAAIHTEDLIAPLVKIKTTNGHIVIDHVDATNAEIISSNAKVEVSSSIIQESITAKSSNAAMLVRVDKGKHIIADVKTTNGSPILYMPVDFEGSLEAKTSSNNKVILVDPTHWLHIRTIGKGYLMGERYESESSKGDGHVQLKTSNANAQLYFENYN